MNDVCKICNAAEPHDEPLNLFDENEIEAFIFGVYFGAITIRSLSQSVYYKTAQKLTEGVFEGWGKKLIEIDYGTPDYLTVQSLQQNVYIFSAAKDYQQTKLVSSFIEKDGKLRPYNEFRKMAKAEFERFNENYLRTEYNTAISQARAARLWQTIEADKAIYPQITYMTVGDARVRVEHAALHKITRPVDDPFWDKWTPPLSWNCRCTLQQSMNKRSTDLKNFKEPSQKQAPEVFRFNPGKSKIIFSPQHPYFEVAKQDREIAKQNFFLPLP